MSGSLLAAILSANLVTLATDLQAGASSLNVLLGIPVWIVAVALSVGVLAVLVVERHEELIGLLRYLVLWCILVAGAAALGRRHVRVTGVVAAAQALRLIAGALSRRPFAIGLFGSALVA